MRLVFVSSTFKDMQFERDELKNRVAPRIDSFLASYGENVHFGDLRWGVNTAKMSEEESAKKVLKVCLDEIDDCRPYMIVFIGERYGWIPSQELISEAAKIRGIESIDPNISVTNLEIEYGALLNPDFEGHILFYFRNLDTSEMDEEEKKIYEAESSLHKEKLDALKKTILEKYPGFVRNYDAKYDKNTKKIVNLNPVMDDVYNDLCRIFKIDLDKFEALPNYQRAIMNSKTRFEKYSKNAYRRNDVDYSVSKWDILENAFDNRYKNAPIFLDVAGESGGGKKTTLAIMYEEAQKDTSIHSYPFVVGLDKYTKGAYEFVEFMMRVLEDELGLERYDFEHNTFDNIKLNLAMLVERHAQSNNYVRFFIMSATKEIIDLIRYLEATLDSHIIHISFYTNIEYEEYNDALPTPFYIFGDTRFLLPLEKEEKYGIIRAILKSKHKELPESVIKLITTKEESDIALYLSLIVERLLLLDHQDFQNIRNMGDGMVAIENYMKKIVNESGDSLKDISKELLKELKERINPEMVPVLLKLLTYDYKLTNKEIEEFFAYKSLNWDNVDFSLFMHSIPSLFKDSSMMSPYLEFKISEVKIAAKELVEDWDVEDFSDDIIEFLESKERDDIDRDKQLIEAYRGFNKPEKSAKLYLNILNKLIDDRITEYEKEVFKQLENEYHDYPEYYYQVSKILIDYLSEGKVDNPPRLCAYFYRFLDIYLNNNELKELWARLVVDTIGYIYKVYSKNKKNDDLFFILMVGIIYIDNYFKCAIKVIMLDYDECSYYKYFQKAEEMFISKNTDKYLELLEDYKTRGFNDYYLDFYTTKQLIANLNIAIKEDKIDEYIEENEEDINGYYDYYLEDDNEFAKKLLNKDNDFEPLVEKDEGAFLSVLAAKFVIDLENGDYESALEVFDQYSTVLLKYRNSFWFFKKIDKSNNIGPFILAESVVEFLMFVRVHAIADFPDELSDEFEELYLDDLFMIIPVVKLYLSEHYEDTEAIAHYQDILQAILTYRPDASDEENTEGIDIEEMAYNFIYVLGLFEWATTHTNPTRLLVSHIYLKSNFFGYIYKDIEGMNRAFVGSIAAAYWLYMNKHDEEEDQWHDDIIYIIASYLISTNQTKNNELIKYIYKEFYEKVYVQTYKEFKQDLKLEIMESEYRHAKIILDLVDEEDEE